MSATPYILDEQLPLSQDFKMLRAEGLAYIQEYSGFEWSNLNASDPGVTILDQLCFALTELGYCNDFTVSDILTNSDGELEVNNQFYLPEDILTTAPVTINDYRKYIIDGVNGVKNVLIVVKTDASGLKIKAPCQIYLLIDPAVADTEANNICLAAYFYLNKSRNVGERFLTPNYLKNIPVYLTGQIAIANAADKDSIVTQAADKIRDYIFPYVSQTGYYQLNNNGAATNEIFNGPLLQNGFIPDNALGNKKDRFTIAELVQLIGEIPGVKLVTDLLFAHELPDNKTVTCNYNEVIAIQFMASLAKGLVISCNGKVLSGNANLSTVPGNSPVLEVDLVFGASANIQPNLPAGNYRDIGNYYSIQNTFPEIFAVGADAINSNAPDFKIAQSRQLKGYLTLFDQVLANQFAQLANTAQLFSFKNQVSGAPSEVKEFYEKKNEYEKKHLEYPVPFLTFSPTYFYQSLYEVPHIKPLLKNHDAFKFSTEIESEKELERNSWAAYKQDPYNAYMLGLMEFMDEEKTSLVRRNDILDHLLARHGESPAVIDSIIYGSSYTADGLKDQVIFKSLYLQNIGLLSYYRYKGYNFLGADIMPPIANETIIKSNKQRAFGSETTDFIFDSEKIDRIEKLEEEDFSNFSAIELKLSLLFGLKILYNDFITTAKDSADIRLAVWLIQQQCGFIFVEKALLSSDEAK